MLVGSHEDVRDEEPVDAIDPGPLRGLFDQSDLGVDLTRELSLNVTGTREEYEEHHQSSAEMMEF